MSKDEKENRSKPKSGALDKFEPGGELGPLDDRNEYEQRLNSLPAEQKESRRRKHALCRSLPVLLAAKDGYPAVHRRKAWKCFQASGEGSHSRHERHQSRTDGVPQ